MAKNKNSLNQRQVEAVVDTAIDPEIATSTPSSNESQSSPLPNPAPEFIDPHHPSGALPEDPPIHRASAYAVAQAQLDAAADFMDLDGDIRSYLRSPQREMIVHFPVRMDDGRMRMFTGFPSTTTPPKARPKAVCAITLRSR